MQPAAFVRCCETPKVAHDNLRRLADHDAVLCCEILEWPESLQKGWETGLSGKSTSMILYPANTSLGGGILTYFKGPLQRCLELRAQMVPPDHR
eukprot:s117_g4.t1